MTSLSTHASGSTISMIVTGASRGFGRAVALAFGEHFLSKGKSVVSPHLYLRLVARSKEGLEETARFFPTDNDRVKVSYLVADLSDSNTIDATIDELSSFWKEGAPTSKSNHHCIFINNAGSLGYIGPTNECPSLQDFQEAMALNVTNALWMSTRMAQYAVEMNTHMTIVNISSLLAIEPMPMMATYSATKAARDAFHTALARENVIPHLRILNYAPGPLKTDMSWELLKHEAMPDHLRPTDLLEPLTSARVLMQLLKENTFVNGAHVDYYDCVE